MSFCTDVDDDKKKAYRILHSLDKLLEKEKVFQMTEFVR